MNPPHTKINENVTQSGFSLYSVNEGLKEQFSIISRVCTYVGKKATPLKPAGFNWSHKVIPENWKNKAGFVHVFKAFFFLLLSKTRYSKNKTGKRIFEINIMS